MAEVTIADINTLSDLVVIASSLFLFYKWRKRNFSFAISFLPIAVVFTESFFLNLFAVTDTLGYLLRGINSAIITVSIAHACTQILRNSKHLYPVFALYALFPLALFITSDLNQILVFIRFISFTVLFPYFALLFAVEHHEIKAVSFLGMCAVVSSAFLWLAMLINPATSTALPWFVPKALFGLLFLGLAHFTIHMPDGILGHEFKRRHR